MDGLRATERLGREPVKSDAASAVVAGLLAAPVPDRPNWTLPRLQVEIGRQAGVSISKSQLSKVLKKTATDGVVRATVFTAGKMPTRSIEPD